MWAKSVKFVCLVRLSGMASGVRVTKTDDEEELWSASSKGDINTLKALLQRGVYPNVIVW